MKRISLLIAAVFIFGATTVATAQDTEEATHSVAFTVPTFAILDVEGGAVSFDLGGAITEAGSAFSLSGVTDNSLWLNYSALVARNNNGGGSNSLATQKVTVKVDELVPGIDLMLEVDADAGNGAGTKGALVETQAFALSTSPADIIDGIGSCYTGDGTSNGHNLTYSLALNDYSAIEAGSKSVTVTYTITAE